MATKRMCYFPSHSSTAVVIGLEIVRELDSMRWFSHRRRSAHKDGFWKKCRTRPRPRGQLSNKMRHFSVFVPDDLELWPWHLNSGEISVQCT